MSSLGGGNCRFDPSRSSADDKNIFFIFCFRNIFHETDTHVRFEYEWANPRPDTEIVALELEEKKPGTQSYEEVLADVIRRDEQDMNRAIAPLKQAEDAVLVDTTNADLAESEQMLLDVCKEKLRL